MKNTPTIPTASMFGTIVLLMTKSQCYVVIHFIYKLT